MGIFFFKKPEDFSLNTGTLKSQKKIRISRLSESVSPSIEVFWGASDLLGTWCQNIHSPLDSTKKCYLVPIFAENGIFAKNILSGYFCKKTFEMFWRRYDLILSILSKQMGPLIDASITTQECEEIINATLKQLRHSNLNNVIFSYLNINSIRKVSWFRYNSRWKYILRIAETKLDECFSQWSVCISV